MTPIDIIANAIRTAGGDHALSAGQLAEVVAEALTDPAIVEHVAHALIDQHLATFMHNARPMARIALTAVGGA